MEEQKRTILTRVAAGELSPEEAAYELQELESASASPAEPAGNVAVASAGAKRIRLIGNMGSVILLADAAVREASAQGPHTARREGDTLVIESNPESEGFRFGPFIGFNTRRLVVRVNPDLPIDADVSAGSLRVVDVRGPITANVQAGSVVIGGVASPIDLDVQAGSVRVSGRLTAGESRIRCRAGSVQVELEPGSSVRVRARNTLGKVTLPGGRVSTGLGADVAEAVVGDGKGTLQIDAELGSVTVTA
jgi:hypothetical protein